MPCRIYKLNFSLENLTEPFLPSMSPSLVQIDKLGFCISFHIKPTSASIPLLPNIQHLFHRLSAVDTSATIPVTSAFASFGYPRPFFQYRIHCISPPTNPIYSPGSCSVILPTYANSLSEPTLILGPYVPFLADFLARDPTA